MRPSRGFFWGGRAIAWLVLAVVVGPVRAQSTVEAERFQVTNWQTQEGLPSNKIMGVLQSRDGYLWIATYEGLVRFDGVRFTLFDSAKVSGWHDSGVTFLHESSAGVMWIAHADGRVSSLKDGVFAGYRPHRAWKGGKIQGIATDETGDAWVLDNTGILARVRDGLMLRPEVGTALGLAQMTTSASGRVWLTVGGVLSELRAGRVDVVSLPHDAAGYVHGLCAARDGGVWAAANGRLWKLDGDGTFADFGELQSGFSPLHAFVETHDGRLVAGTSDHGALVIHPTERGKDQQLHRASGFASDWVSSVCEDHEGGIWLGTGSSGVFKLRNKKVSMLLPADGWQGRSVLTVTPARDGGVWVGTEGAGVYRLADGAWRHLGGDAGLQNPYVWSVYETGETVWAGTWIGLSHLVGEKFEPAPGTGTPWTAITALLPASRGGMWVGSRFGLLHYQDGVVRWAEPESGRKLREVRAIAEQSDGTVWVGCNGDGLGRIRAGEVAQFRQGDGLSSDFIQCLHLGDDGALWIGTRGGGLSRLKDGRFSAVTVDNGLANGSICHIADDGMGYFWMSSRGGIMRVSKEEMSACADGRLALVDCLSYGVNDGLLTLSCSGGLQPAGCRMADGRLVFATDRGLAVVDPGKVERNPHAPPVVIESLRVGDRVVAENVFPGGSIEVGPGQTRIEIKYTGLSLAAPEKVRFRRRLEGLEEDWLSVGGERLAVYNYVPPGRYVFHVTASNNDNAWNTEGRSIAIVVLPHFWQTLWFKLVVLGLLLLATSGVVWIEARRRLHRRLEMLERERAISAERTRIANDMHDDLGSHLTRITMLSETARAEIGDRARIESGLGQIYETARDVTRAMDEIVWAVNPKHDTLESLVSYFEKFAQDLLRAAGMRCRLELPEEIPAWNPETNVRHNLFLAFKEVLNNAVRHSQAGTVTISLAVDADDCRIAISDDGCGFNPLAPDGIASRKADRAAVGNGLPSVHQRMQGLGGACEVRSEPGQGCTVTLVVPLTTSVRPRC